MKQEIVVKESWPGTEAIGWTAGVRTIHENGDVSFRGFTGRTRAEALAELEKASSLSDSTRTADTRR